MPADGTDAGLFVRWQSGHQAQTDDIAADPTHGAFDGLSATDLDRLAEAHEREIQDGEREMSSTHSPTFDAEGDADQELTSSDDFSGDEAAVGGCAMQPDGPGPE